jgi:hypothetical protein
VLEHGVKRERNSNELLLGLDKSIVKKLMCYLDGPSDMGKPVTLLQPNCHLTSACWVSGRRAIKLDLFDFFIGAKNR